MRRALGLGGVILVLAFLWSSVCAEPIEKVIPPLMTPSKNAKEMDSDLVIVAIAVKLPIAEKKNISGERVLVVRSSTRNLPETRLCVIADEATYPGVNLEMVNEVMSSIVVPWLGKTFQVSQTQLKLDDCLTDSGNFIFQKAISAPLLVAIERKALPALLDEPDLQRNPHAVVILGALSKEGFFAQQRILADKRQSADNVVRSKVKALAEAASAEDVSTLGSIILAQPRDKVQLCAIDTGEAGTPFLLGYSFAYTGYLPEEWVRKVKETSPKVKFEQTKYFHKTYKSLDDFYVKLRESDCHIFVGTPVEVNSLRSALLRDSGKEHNDLGAFVSKNELAEGWAKAVGFDSFKQSDFARKIGVDATTVKGLGEFQITSEENLLAALAMMRSSGYADSKDPKVLLGFLRDKQAGEREGKTAVAVRAERQQKEARDAERRAIEQKKAREEYAKKFPFTAVISCSLGESALITLNACFVSKYTQTELEIKNGADYRMYTPRDIFSAGHVTEQGLEIPLQKSFDIKAQNAGEGVLLTVKIIDNKSGSVAFKKSASQYGVVRATN